MLTLPISSIMSLLQPTWLQGEGVVGNRRTFAMGYLQEI